MGLVASAKEAILSELGLEVITRAPPAELLLQLGREAQAAILFASFVACVLVCAALGLALFGNGACCCRGSQCCLCLLVRVCWVRVCSCRCVNEKLESLLDEGERDA